MRYIITCDSFTFSHKRAVGGDKSVSNMNSATRILFLFICYLISTNYKCVYAKDSRRNSFKPHAFLDSEISILSNDLSDTDDFTTALNHIAVERVPGTPEHARVKDYIIKQLKSLNLHVETDKFSSKTPFGSVEFENIIATSDPKADRFIVLAAHYDSKYFKNIRFIGATDSAVPCAMLLNLVKTLKPFLDEKRLQNTAGGGVSLKLVFFDGEEAFVDWSDKDSIYGARHLAKKWQNEGELDKIELLVLLDLIGTPDPSFHSFFRETDRPFERLISAEDRLSEMGHLARYSRGSSQQRYFKTRGRFGGGIQDDHIPFLQRGVPIMHLITSPFPDCWHTADDNLDVVDYATVENLQKIFRVFTAEYLKLNIH